MWKDFGMWVQHKLTAYGLNGLGAQTAAEENLDKADMALNQTQIFLEAAQVAHAMAAAEWESKAYMLAERLREEQIVWDAEAAWLLEEVEQIAPCIEVVQLQE